MRTIIASAAVALLFLAAPSARAFDLVKAGQPAATVLLPKAPDPTEQAAANLLQKYVALATGARLQVVKEPERPQGNVISVGHTDAAGAAGITENGLVCDGYRLAVKGDTLFVLGRDLPLDTAKVANWAGTRGTYRAAFGLLQALGFRWVVPGEKGTYFPVLTGNTLSAPDALDITYTPSFLYHMTRFDRFGDWTWANSFRTAANFYVHGGHTWDLFVPKELWDQHPEYFAMDKNGQRVKPTGFNNMLCPTNAGVIALLADGLRKKFDEGFEVVELGQSDGFWPCHCPQCKALGAGYETDQVHYAHAKAIAEAYKTHPNKFALMTIYGPTKTPSKVVTEYPPNTMFELCSSDEDFISRWAPKAKGGSTCYVYYFGLYQHRGLLPKQSAAYMTREIAKLYRLGIRGIYWCGGAESWPAEGPTYYALAQAALDPAANPAASLSEYCSLLYGKAGPIMTQYYGVLQSRLGRDDGALSLNEALVKNYPPSLLERADALLTQAKGMTGGDERAANWLRLAEYGHRHIRLMANVAHLYAAYEINRTVDNIKQIQAAADAFRKFVDEVEGLDKSDPAFVRDYFVNYRLWREGVRTNAKQIGSPFKWDFNAILAANLLPGRDRNSAVIPRLPKPPAMEGRFDDAAWKGVEPVALNEIAMGKVEAPTRMRMGYDDKNLYFAFECAEPLIDEMKVRDCKRDGPVWRTECVEVVLDPFAEGTKHMHFIATPSATGVYDARRGYIDDPLHPLVLSGSDDGTWNPEWRHAFTIDKERKTWTVEMAIPFAALEVPPPSDGSRWRANFARERNRAYWGLDKYKNAAQDVYLWSPNLQKVSILDSTAAGDLYFGRRP